MYSWTIDMSSDVAKFDMSKKKKKKKKIQEYFFFLLSFQLQIPKFLYQIFQPKQSLRSQNSYISICIYIHIRKGLFKFSDIHDFGETEALIEWCKYQHHGFSPKGLKFIWFFNLATMENQNPFWVFFVSSLFAIFCDRF